ncbi:hypothetical protein MMPV_000447 [Pyropia vietnamensis]
MASEDAPDMDTYPPSPTGLPSLPPPQAHPPHAALAAELATARSTMGQTMLSSYWATAAAAAIAVPVCVRTRSMGPLLGLFALGSAIDYAVGYHAASAERERVEVLREALAAARRDNGGG